MNKIALSILVPLFFVSIVSGHSDREDCSTIGTGEYMGYFFKGVAAGLTGTLAVEFLRSNVLPNMDSYKLYDNYGVCRDRLEGRVSAVLAALGLVVLDKISLSDVKKAGVHLTGILVGAVVANYAPKYLLSSMEE